MGTELCGAVCPGVVVRFVVGYGAALAALGISEREFQTLVLLADGLTNKEIARQLSVSPNTVKTHVGHLYASWRSPAAPRPCNAPGRCR